MNTIDSQYKYEDTTNATQCDIFNNDTKSEKIKCHLTQRSSGRLKMATDPPQ